jgi:hypothetical protein
MFPYPRDLIQPSREAEDTTWEMVTTPYTVNGLSSSTDSSSRELDTNDVNRWMRYSAFTSVNQEDYKNLFSKPSVDWISMQISLRLQGVHPEGKMIVVPEETILTVADSFFNSSYLNIEQLREQVVMYIVEQIRLDFQLTAQNDKLSAWVTVMGMDTGLSRYSRSEIKLNEKRPTHHYQWNY